MIKPNSPLAPLNYRLEFINEDGSKNRLAMVDAASALIERERARATDDSKNWSLEAWWNYATQRIESCADGELQLYEGRKMNRDLGQTNVHDVMNAMYPGPILKRAREERGAEVVDHLYRIAVGAPLDPEAAIAVDLPSFRGAAE